MSAPTPPATPPRPPSSPSSTVSRSITSAIRPRMRPRNGNPATVPDFAYRRGVEPSRARPKDFLYQPRLSPPLSTPRPFAEHRKGDWISDVKSNKSRRRSAHSKNDHLKRGRSGGFLCWVSSYPRNRSASRLTAYSVNPPPTAMSCVEFATPASIIRLKVCSAPSFVPETT